MKNTRDVTIKDKLRLYYDIELLKLKNIKRDYKIINQEYNDGFWSGKSADTANFETWVGNYGNSAEQVRIYVRDGKFFKGTKKEYAEEYYLQLDNVLEQYKNESIVELGCGRGHILFRLYHKNCKKLTGYDISENAISQLQEYCTQKKYPINFDVQDLNKPFSPEIIKNKIVYTHTCLEQLKNYMPNVLKNIINGKPKLVINFEVDYDSSPFIVKEYFKAKDYQNNLVRELKKLEKQNKVEIVSIKKFSLALSPTNRLSTIIWKIK
jgi:cyclopropane fatty-acyl-phospholipid synthase-like methyltransferase